MTEKRVAPLMAGLRNQIDDHSLMVRLGTDFPIPDQTLLLFARAQYADCVTWIPMLALMRDRCINSILRQAIWDNICDEAGQHRPSHVTMAQRFIASLRLPAELSNVAHYTPASWHSYQIMMKLAHTGTEATIAGWVLAQEYLVPVFFAAFRKRFELIPGVDIDYLVEHEEVDTDRHYQWLLEAVDSLCQEREVWGEVESGILMSARSVLSVLDWLSVDMSEVLEAER